MTFIQYDVEKGDVPGVVVSICQLVIGMFAFAITFLAFIWGVYFLFRVRELSRKVHYMKKQTDERCREELTSARVDFTKSLFIAIICLVEVADLIFILIAFVHHYSVRQDKIHNCPGDTITDSLYHEWVYRLLIAVSVSCMLVYTSMVHILTSYMCNAYAEPRLAKLTKREKLLFLLLFIQIVVVLLSASYWRTFVFVIFLYALSLFPIHLCLFYKYSRKLHILLKRRALDTWYEDAQLHNRLKGMCQEYILGAKLYTISIALIGLTLSLMPLGVFGKMVLRDKCRLNYLLNTDFDWLNTVYAQNKQNLSVLGDVITIFYNLFAVFSVGFLFSLNVMILYQAIKRLVKRRIAYNTYTGTRTTELYRPLIGNK